MKVVDKTYLNRIKAFLVTFIAGSLGYILFKLSEYDFDINMLELDYYNVIPIGIVGIFASISVNKIKLVVKNIENLDELINWTLTYFKKYEGEIIYRREDVIIIKLSNKIGRFFRKYQNSYYKINIKGRNALIQGPDYRKPNYIV